MLCHYNTHKPINFNARFTNISIHSLLLTDEVQPGSIGSMWWCNTCLYSWGEQPILILTNTLTKIGSNISSGPSRCLITEFLRGFGFNWRSKFERISFGIGIFILTLSIHMVPSTSKVKLNLNCRCRQTRRTTEHGHIYDNSMEETGSRSPLHCAALLLLYIAMTIRTNTGNNTMGGGATITTLDGHEPSRTAPLNSSLLLRVADADRPIRIALRRSTKIVLGSVCLDTDGFRPRDQVKLMIRFVKDSGECYESDEWSCLCNYLGSDRGGQPQFSTTPLGFEVMGGVLFRVMC